MTLNVTATRFDLTNITAGTTAIGNLGIGFSDKVVFGVVGTNMVVFRIPQ